METGTGHIRIYLLAACLLFALGCQKKGQESPSGDDTADIVCPQLYQGMDSLADALAFIEVPEDRLESSLAFVSRRGQLADSQQLVFANKLLSLRQNRDTELFKSLLSDATRKELDGPDTNKQMVRHHLREIEAGTFLYGEWDFRFFAAFHTLTQDERDMLAKHVRFAQPPTHAIEFYHFHTPKTMLIGTRNYLIQDGDAYRIVTETLLRGELPAATEDEESSASSTPTDTRTTIDH